MNDRLKFRVGWECNVCQAINVAVFVFDPFASHTHECECGSQFHGGSTILYTEQCTGLKDQNGRLIYEGDIVRVIDAVDRGYGNGHDDAVMEVFFETGDLSWSLRDLSDALFLAEYDVEVIGNVHTDAHLLES